MKIVIFRPRFQSDGEFLIETFFFPLKHSAGPRSRLAAAQQSQWRDHVKLPRRMRRSKRKRSIERTFYFKKKSIERTLDQMRNRRGKPQMRSRHWGGGAFDWSKPAWLVRKPKGKRRAVRSPSRGRQEEDIFVRPKRTISKDFANISQDQAPNY